MTPSTKLLAILALTATGVACSTARDPAKGFRLAGNGDTHRGRAAFLEFGCNSCHQVQGANLPSPAIRPVVLGGSVVHQPSDGYLVTAIINPAYHANRYPAANGSGAGQTRMPEYASRMTVQQLTDIVAYLQSRYALSPFPVQNEYPQRTCLHYSSVRRPPVPRRGKERTSRPRDLATTLSGSR